MEQDQAREGLMSQTGHNPMLFDLDGHFRFGLVLGLVGPGEWRYRNGGPVPHR